MRADRAIINQRINAAVDAVKSLDNVDPDRIVLIGYCFGGTGVLGFALAGESDVKGIVSFHGGLSRGFDPVDGVISPRMLVQSGGDDDDAADIEALEAQMKLGNATWEYTRYGEVEHAFTNWADARGRYDARADVRSWEDMQTFLTDLFVINGTVGIPAPSDESSETAPPPTPEPISAGVIATALSGIILLGAILPSLVIGM